jgi:ABC-type phosphate transport system permease subunit
MGRFLFWLLAAIVGSIVVGAVALAVMDIPYQPKTVEVPVENDALGL